MELKKKKRLMDGKGIISIGDLGLVISRCTCLIISFSKCMIGKNMSEKYLGTFIMNIRIKLYLALFVLFLSGCMGTITQPVDVPDDCVEEDVSVVKGDNGFVNYTDVAADYRRYGERNQRDQDIVKSGAGSNISASIPPSVDEEVSEYEEDVADNVSGSYDNTENALNAEDPVEDWLAEEGQNLKSLLGEWSDRAGWRLVWKTNRNYPLTAGAMFRGRFADASAALIRTFARAKPAPVATFYKGNRVLVVETMEDENAFE